MIDTLILDTLARIPNTLGTILHGVEIYINVKEKNVMAVYHERRFKRLNPQNLSSRA